ILPKSHKKALISSDQEQSDASASDTTDRPLSSLKWQENLMNWFAKPITQDQQSKLDKKLLE
ncbi:18503_t:CDS:2, partial [Dentiscutata erythropus]